MHLHRCGRQRGGRRAPADGAAGGRGRAARRVAAAARARRRRALPAARARAAQVRGSEASFYRLIHNQRKTVFKRWSSILLNTYTHWFLQKMAKFNWQSTVQGKCRDETVELYQLSSKFIYLFYVRLTLTLGVLCVVAPRKILVARCRNYIA